MRAQALIGFARRRRAASQRRFLWLVLLIGSIFGGRQTPAFRIELRKDPEHENRRRNDETIRKIHRPANRHPGEENVCSETREIRFPESSRYDRIEEQNPPGSDTAFPTYPGQTR